MNNEFNAAEAEKARQFQLDMWNRENRYNTASVLRAGDGVRGYIR